MDNESYSQQKSWAQQYQGISFEPKIFQKEWPFMHIEQFNEMTRVHGLTPLQWCGVFPLTLE